MFLKQNIFYAIVTSLLAMKSKIALADNKNHFEIAFFIIFLKGLLVSLEARVVAINPYIP